MTNIGNNKLDNLQKLRRPYIAPDMLMEEIVEEGEMMAGSNKSEVTNPKPGSGSGNDPFGAGAKQNTFFFDGEDTDYTEE